MNRTISTFSAGAPWLLLGLLLVSCFGGSDTTTTTTDPVGTGEGPTPLAAVDLPTGKQVSGTPTRVPFILWGGDMATFYGNRGTRTLEGSVFAKHGLNVELVRGDDFAQQVEDYKAGRSPYLRGTFRMVGMVMAELCEDPDTCPMPVMQMTWSAGDHMVAREEITDLKSLKGKTGAIQKGGPHVGMMDDILRDANLTWDDINVVWMDNVTGEDSPVSEFRSNTEVDFAFAITPDMFGLTGGLDTAGTGAEGTVKGARVAVSTAERSYTIADMYFVRPDYYRDHALDVQKFAVAYLESVEKVIDLKKAYEGSGSDEFLQLLTLTQSIYGEADIPTLEDAHGLIADCNFVGHPGNVSFFTEQGNPRGFEVFVKRSNDLAVGQGYAKKRAKLEPSPLDWTSTAFTSVLTKTSSTRAPRFQAEAVQSEIEALDAGGKLDDNTILSFTISFEANQTVFSAAQYRKEYDKAVELLGQYGNAVLVIRGHADPTKTLKELVEAGIAKGVLKRSGTAGAYTYYYNGRPLDLNDTEAMVQLVQSGAFDGDAEHNPRETLTAALNLSLERAEEVRNSVSDYASAQGLKVDPSQIQPQGVGIREPLIAKPRSMDEAQQNMRVEFRLIRITAEIASTSDFDF